MLSTDRGLEGRGEDERPGGCRYTPSLFFIIMKTSVSIPYLLSGMRVRRDVECLARPGANTRYRYTTTRLSHLAPPQIHRGTGRQGLA